MMNQENKKTMEQKISKELRELGEIMIIGGLVFSVLTGFGGLSIGIGFGLIITNQK